MSERGWRDAVFSASYRARGSRERHDGNRLSVLTSLRTPLFRTATLQTIIQADTQTVNNRALCIRRAPPSPRPRKLVRREPRVPPQSLEVAVSLKGRVVAGWAVEAREAASLSRKTSQPDEGRTCVIINTTPATTQKKTEDAARREARTPLRG